MTMRVSQLKLILCTTILGHMTALANIPQFYDAFGNSFGSVTCGSRTYMKYHIYAQVEKFRHEVKADPNLADDPRFRSLRSSKKIRNLSGEDNTAGMDNNERKYFVPLMGDAIFSAG
ncbi:hypothetical protein Golomagni_05583 [Golovinomyces magnicellulatus]|nr:hypothetical protein Golomagni_05583 [Golovinomyces magnicellulatus]